MAERAAGTLNQRPDAGRRRRRSARPRAHVPDDAPRQHLARREGPRSAVADPARSRTRRFSGSGVIDLESFYPAKDRFALAMQLNTLMAAPGFEQWLQGEPLDAATLLYGAAGKPRVSVVSIAHLGDAERMFVVTLLLNQVVAWMRAQTGTTSLRAIIYMDEIAGYFPPVANPPSKAPLLTLMKQARAFGIGILLATQNTVDIDYKGLSNAGTWFLGRLQTERDKGRVLDGLEGAAGRGLRSGGSRSHVVGVGEARLSAPRHSRKSATDVPDAVVDVVSPRPAVARSDPDADELAPARRLRSRGDCRRGARQTSSRPRAGRIFDSPRRPARCQAALRSGRGIGRHLPARGARRRARELRGSEAAGQRGQRHRRRRADRRWRRRCRLDRRRSPRRCARDSCHQS